MLRVPIHKIEPGMVLARPIPAPDDSRRFLLQRGVEIPVDLIPRLRQLGVYEVWIRNRDLEFLEDLFDEGLDHRQREIYRHVRTNFEAIMRGTSQELELTQFEKSIGELFSFLRRTPSGDMLLSKLDAYDNYLLSHSANVCYLALLLGMKLERYLIDQRPFKRARDAKDLQLLGLGCLLHDVGKLRVPAAILNKPTKLTDEEFEEMKRHTEYGYEMLRKCVPASAAQVALNHHQRWRGDGYPQRLDRATGKLLPPLAGPQIPVYCRIATICDMYDAATTRRCYSRGKLPVQVLWEMRNRCQGFFDPVVEQAFYQVIPPFPIGEAVTLSNGIEAAVVDFNPLFPYQPKVQGLKAPTGEPFAHPDQEEIDLSRNPELQIAFIDGIDVRPYQSLAVEHAMEDEELLV